MIRRAIVFAAVLALLVTGLDRSLAGQGGRSSADSGGRVDAIGAEPIVTGLENPAAFTLAADGRIFYGERLTGEVRVFDPDDGSNRLVGFIPNLVTSGERGLLGIALLPSINPLPLVFATRFVNGVPTNQILRVTANPSVIFSSNTPSQSIHNGGRILFGPDARLYAIIGDAANPGNAQDLSRHAGKVLRMTLSGGIPPDNPFGTHVWAYGIRNSFGFTFDPVNGRLWEEDNGPECNDEINLIGKGANMAWGPNETCSSPPPPPQNTNQDGPNPVLPLAWFTPPTAPTGMAFCVGCGLPDSEGTLFFGNFNTRQIVRVVLNASRDGIVSITPVYTHPRSILSVERGPDKAIYLSDSQGIYKLVED
ncbi:MAG: PQQ-dependent sugar dehydrogenase [Actinomycetota bacterium]